MAAMPQPRSGLVMPSRPLTVAEYADLGETEPGYTELVEGRIVISPSPTPDHNVASGRLHLQLAGQLAASVEVIQDVDIDLELAPADQPGFSRRPDLVVVERTARERVRTDGGLIRASEVLVVVEIVSPSSRRTDHVIKRGEYADAGIPYYWIVDIGDPVCLVACHHTEEFGYQDAPAVTGTFRTTAPFAVSVDLAHLM